MKKPPEDQLVFNFDKIDAKECVQTKSAIFGLKLVHSRPSDVAASESSSRDKILQDVLSYARTLKW